MSECDSLSRPTWALGVILRKEALFSCRIFTNSFLRFHRSLDPLNGVGFTTELTAYKPPGFTEHPSLTHSTMTILRSGTFFLVPNPPLPSSTPYLIRVRQGNGTRHTCASVPFPLLSLL